MTAGTLGGNDDLFRWLDSVTKGLPEEVSTCVREELTAHYEDALQDYRARGKSLDEAHQAVMADLGEDNEIGEGLRDTYLLDRRYVRAMIASTIFPVVCVLLAAKPHLGILRYDIIFYAAILIPTPYLLYTFRKLLAVRFGFEQLGHRVPLVCCGMVALSVPSIVSCIFRNEVVHLNNMGGQIAYSLLTTGTLLALATYAGLGITGMGLILLSDRLIHLHDSLYGLIIPLRYGSLLTGVGLLSGLVGALLNAEAFTGLMNLLTTFAFIIVNTLWTLLFFRAAYHGTARPMQTT